MVSICFESHSTTFDNEAHRSSGWNDVALSPLGEEQSRDLGTRRAHEAFAAVFCSDLCRSVRTAEIAFGDRFPILSDARLRECDYGDLTQAPSDLVTAEKPRRISTPFPNGESYEDAARRMYAFLADLLHDYDGKRVLIIGHRATQYGLEHWIRGIALPDVVSASWAWQPGWEYHLEQLPERMKE